LPTALSLSFLSAFTGVFIKKTGQYLPMIWFGMILMTLGFGLFIDFDVNTSWAKIIVFQIIAGIGVGPNFQSPLIALQSLVPVSSTQRFFFCFCTCDHLA
jgi:hydrogenase/urease accessory protein HupE